MIIKNRRYIPPTGPVIFVANHPNSMIDPILIACATKRKLHFLAKSSLFKKPLSAWFLTRLKLIPVYRKKDNPETMKKNVEIFSRCYEILKQNKSFLIFPEGVSVGDRILHRIKTGAARIGFGAEAENDFTLNVMIIPVGLSYSNSVKFRSEVYVRFGKPIKLKEFRKDFIEDEIEAVTIVTQQIETALSKLTTNIQEQGMEDIVTALESIYKKELIVDLGMERKDKHVEFSVTKGLINAVEWFMENEPERVGHLQEKLTKYLDNLDRLHLKDEFLNPSRESISFGRRIKTFLFIMLGFPVYLYGLLNNYIPYRFPRWYAQHFVREKSMWASMKMVTGMAVFLIYYAVLITLFGIVSGNTLLTILYSITLIPSGNFVLKYMGKVKAYRQHMRFISIFYQKRQLVYNLIEQRMQIKQFLDAAKQEYMQAVGLQSPKQ